jgi:hypothetical protein
MNGFERSLLVLYSALVLTMSACGNPLDSSSENAVSAGIGIDQCYSCHLDTGYTFYNASFASTIQTIFTEWGQSAHGNAGNFPNTGFFGHQPASDCTICHDRNLDSRNLAILAATGAPGGSTTPRPVVGCEACHGSGDGHINTSFPVAYPEPDFDRCGQCHNASFNEVTHSNPEGDEIVEDYKSSPHIHSLNEHTLLDTTTVNARCAKCHTDEGARQYATMDVGTYPISGQSFYGLSAVQCRTCHQAHNPSKLLREGIGVGSPEFNTCTGCHEMVDGSGTPVVTVHDPVNPFGKLEEIIYDTHLATPLNLAPWVPNTNPISGYAMSFSESRVCRNCHNVHSGDVTINKQWAQSAHADTSASGAWAHYNWSSVASSCQRCHTTSGVIAYLTTNAQASTPYLPPLSSDFGYKPQMLHCDGCHSDNTGTLRAPGSITGEYSNAAFAYTDISGSNLCMACHAGQESGGSIQNSSADFSTTDFVSSHYLAAGGTLYQAIGYEYAATYANFSFYEHDQIGITETEGIGTEGPCIGCHLTSPENHLFQPVEHSISGTITSITTPVCGECHAGPYALTAAILEEEREELHASLEALKAALADSTLKPAYYFSAAHPYFFEDSGATIPVMNWASIGDVSSSFQATGKPNMGAAFNFNYLHHEPGAYAHNRLYAKLLTFDSIDWLDNNVLDGTIDLSAFPEAAKYLQGDSDPGNDSTVTRPAIY